MNKLQKIFQLYHQLNKSQQNLFNLLYGSVDSIKEDKIEWVIKQCERTINKNIEKRDQKIDQIFSQLPINTKIIKYTQDNKIPESGDLFYYRSKYSDIVNEGIVNKVYNGSISSINGVSYSFKEITIKSKLELREEKLNEILNGKNK